MSEEGSNPAKACAFCGYSLAGLESTLCPECGKEQPPPVAERRVRADRVWIGLTLAGAIVFAALSWVSLGLGTALGGVYTGDQELVNATVGFAVVSAVYLIAALEIYTRRARLRKIDPLTVTQGIATIVLVGVLGFVGVFLSLYV